jgi:predicted transcriptional regulator of viral defense system
MPPPPPREPGEWRFSLAGRDENAKRVVAELAATQIGRVRVDQLRLLGVARARIYRWCDSGYLHRELPGVYAVGHPGRSTESDLAAAVLYAGPGAMLSHATAAWWLGLLKYPPNRIIVSSPRRVKNRGNITVHGRRRLERIWRRGLPVTDPSQTIFDYAGTGQTDLLRLVLANADYNDLLDVGRLSQMVGAGAPALRKALQIHLPQLAHTRSRGERLLLTTCQDHGIQIPEVNVYVHGWLVDALWADQKLVVEIDGPKGHRTRAELQADHQRDLELRAAGYVVLRYTERQLIDSPAAVAADIRRHL